MIDCIALAKILELQNHTLHDQWRKNEDLFYQAYDREGWGQFSWFGNILDRTYAWLKTKKADRPNVDRSACDSDACCGQAASAR